MSGNMNGGYVPYENLGGGLGTSLYGSNIQATANLGLTGGGKIRRRNRTNKKHRSTKRKMRRSKGKRTKQCKCKICKCNPCLCGKSASMKGQGQGQRRKTLEQLRASLKKYN
jgi:hypothetical protein